uniref:Uncharacterized protein n=1 Tax=Heterorhabditis bacteriophora TaxID=37862 RepID=A0A1I7WCK3_HETBA
MRNFLDGILTFWSFIENKQVNDEYSFHHLYFSNVKLVSEKTRLVVLIL